MQPSDISRRGILELTAAGIGLTLAGAAAPISGQTGPAAAGVLPKAPPRWRRRRVDDPATPARLLESYARAVRIMLELPPEDPRNWYRLTLSHTLDCPHGNWWLLPWHRGFVGWVERIVRELSGDADFAFPYWDWTATPRIPDALFEDVLTPTHPKFVDTFATFRKRFEPIVAALPCWRAEHKADGQFDQDSAYAQLLQRGLRFPADLWFDIAETPAAKMFYERAHARGLTRERPAFDGAAAKAVSLPTVLAALAPSDFAAFGSAKALNHGKIASFGPLETQPHNMVHAIVGGMTLPGPDGGATRPGPGGFMQGNMSSVDPIFFLHHANIDRLWDVWTRKQHALGLPHLPAGYDAPDTTAATAPRGQRSDYRLWAGERFLFFVDEHGKPALQTRCGDYAAMAAFDYDYQPGSGEEIVGNAPAPATAAWRKGRVPGTTQAAMVDAVQAARATVMLPDRLLAACMSGAVSDLSVELELEFSAHGHGTCVHLFLDPPEDLRGLGMSDPGHAGTIMLPCAHRMRDAARFAIPIGAALRDLARTRGLSAGQSLRLRIGTDTALPDAIAGYAGAPCGEGDAPLLYVRGVSLLVA